MGTARNIELYSLAYRVALKRISKLQKREQPNIALHLHSFIRRQIKKGATNAFFIASEALKNLQATAAQSGGAAETPVARKRHRRGQRQKVLRIYKETAASRFQSEFL